MLNFRNALFYAATALAAASVSVGTVTSARAAEDLAALNARLIATYKTSQKRERGGANEVPPDVQSAFARLPLLNITTFSSVQELAAAKNPREVVLQEFLRQQTLWGMPWLPLSWTRGNLQHIEESFDDIALGMERVIRGMKYPLNEDDLLIAYLYSGSVYHSPISGNLIDTLRVAADYLGTVDNAGFWDIRNEIHQEPSLRTLSRVEEYVAQTNNPTFLAKGQEILDMVKLLFGSAQLDVYLRYFTPDATALAALNAYQAVLPKIRNANDPAAVKALVPEISLALAALSDVAISTSQTLRNPPAASQCALDAIINCQFERVDLLKQIQTAIFGLGSLVQSQFGKFSVALTPRQAFVLLDAYAGSAASVGFISTANYEDLRAAKLAISSGNPNVSIMDLEGALVNLESSFLTATKRMRAMFGPLFEIYKPFVPQTERFVDDTVKSSTLLPMSNFVSGLYQTVKSLQGTRLRVMGKDMAVPFRVLNPGIAKGKLSVVKEDDLKNEDYAWDPESIVFLTKTPAWLRKVAGILTCDSGSMISHVQLLASNAGLPNVNVSCALVDTLRAYEGQEVMVISLPNGEASIKLWSAATPVEQDIYNEYNKVKQKLKLRIPRPERLDITYPLKLEQLRMSSAGKVAGGKACGQGEMASVFPNRVPKAIVLPFGVYYDHINDPSVGLYAEIQRTFADPKLRGNTPEILKARSEALAHIRESIQKIQLKPEIQAYLAQVLGSYPFRGHGVFVRSDTNAEDLPGFVGAGLNDTISNVVGLENVMKAITKVWSSPFTEKAFTWREDLIENPWDIFPSVLVQIAMNSEKAGVMVVGDAMQADDYDDHILVAGNEGLGATVVNGEFSAEENLISRKDQKIVRQRRAYATTRKELNPNGGDSPQPVRGLTPVVTDGELAQLGMMGDAMQKHVEKTYGRREKWDIEWGAIGGEVVLLQMRVFNGNKVAVNVGTLRKLQSPDADVGPSEVPVDGALFAAGSKQP